MNWKQFAGRVLYLDANIFIYSLEGDYPFARLLRDLFGQIDSGLIAAATSEVTIAEVLTRPFRLGATEQINAYTRILSGGIAVDVVPVSRLVLIEAARIRSRGGLKLVDAIHLATANLRRCDVMLSNDRRLIERRGSSMTGLYLSELQ